MNHHLNIDFARPGVGRSLHRASFAARLLGACGLALCGGAFFVAWQTEAARRADNARLAQARALARGPAVVAAARQPLIAAEQAAAVNAIVTRLNLPWREMHDAIDAATPAGIALMALEPDAHLGTVRITAETRDTEGVIAYVEQLKRQPRFNDVILTRHELNEQDPNHPVRFQLNATWKEAR